MLIAIAIERNFADAHLNRGNLYYNQGKIDLAEADYNKAIAIERNLGLLYEEIGKLEAARTHFQKARELFIEQNNIAAAEEVSKILQEME